MSRKGIHITIAARVETIKLEKQLTRTQDKSRPLLNGQWLDKEIIQR